MKIDCGTTATIRKSIPNIGLKAETYSCKWAVKQPEPRTVRIVRFCRLFLHPWAELSIRCIPLARKSDFLPQKAWYTCRTHEHTSRHGRFGGLGPGAGGATQDRQHSVTAPWCRNENAGACRGQDR